MIEQAIEEERLADEADWVGKPLYQIPDDWRPESVDRTIRDEEEKDKWHERYMAAQKEAEEKRAKQAQAANRLNRSESLARMAATSSPIKNKAMRVSWVMGQT